MRRIWVDLIREERDHPERERERWCGGCALWRLASGSPETERAEAGGVRAIGPDTDEVRDPSAEPGAAETASPASAPIVPGGSR